MTIYAQEVTAADVGARVTLRHLVADEATGRRVPTDVVGHLLEADEHEWRVRRRTGEVVAVRPDDIIGSRLLPPPPVRRRRPPAGGQA